MYHQALSNNDRSIVSFIELYDWQFLLTGDLDEMAEIRLIKHHLIPEVDILKMGHHGSRTSTSDELLIATNPRFVWNSAGRNNWFGHPHPITIKRLEDRRVPYLSTHKHGAITFKVKNQWL